MDLTFRTSKQYFSLQHQTLLPSPFIFTTVCSFCFGYVSSVFLELFLHWSPVAYWAPTNLESSSFSVLSFCLFILFMGFSRQEYWSGLPFPSPVDHIFSKLSIKARNILKKKERKKETTALKPLANNYSVFRENSIWRNHTKIWSFPYCVIMDDIFGFMFSIFPNFPMMKDILL